MASPSHAVVGALLLPHAVDEHGERRRGRRGGSRTREAIHRAAMMAGSGLAGRPGLAVAGARASSPSTASAAPARAPRAGDRRPGRQRRRSTLPQRSPERAAAEAVDELAPWIARRRRALARAAGSWAARRHRALPRRALTLVQQPGRTRVHRRGDALLVPAAATRRRRSSASTGGRRARRSRRGSTPRPRAPARATRA